MLSFRGVFGFNLVERGRIFVSVNVFYFRFSSCLRKLYQRLFKLF